MALVLVKTAALGLALNYGVHVGSSLAYHEFCVPKTVWEIAQSLVTTASPVCSFLLSTMTVTQSNYAAVVSTSLLALVTGAITPLV
jgi:hypothetical protein